MQSSSIVQPTSMMNVKQEPQAPLSNIQSRPTIQNFPMQQQVKQELMAPSIQQQQPGLQVQQMRPQQQQPLPPPPLQYIQQQQTSAPPLQPTTTVPQQRTLAQVT